MKNLFEKNEKDKDKIKKVKQEKKEKKERQEREKLRKEKERKRKNKDYKLKLRGKKIRKKDLALMEDEDKRVKKKRKKKRKWWKRLLSFFLLCGAMGVFAVFAFCIYIVSSCGEFDPNALANQDQSIIYDKNGNIMAKLGMEKRESVKYEDLPQVLIDAIIATEDSRYFEHNGVDGARFLKASVGQLLGNSGAGGASTLTMQVVKNNLTSTEQTITRKFKDIYLAVFFMEKKYTKEEIIEFYVNDSLLGGNVYGVEEASKYYFGKSVSELSLPEASIIAGLFQAPNGYNPYLYPDAAADRRKTVLMLMVRHGYITQEEADIANSVDVSSLLVNNNGYETNYQGFIDTVSAEIEKKTGFDPALVSMEVYTTMDPSIQDGINKIFAGTDGYKWKDENVQAGVSIVDVNTGAIVAIGNGRHRTGKKVLNYATQTYRQPGSTAKPIFAYAPGFEFANFSTYQLFVDEKWAYTEGTSIGNWDHNYKGLMTLREALSISRNIPALKAFQIVNKEAGNKKIVDFVEGLGIDLENDIALEAYSIGGMGKGVSTLQMASAYAAFANGGYYTEPYTVKSITYRETGETVEFEVKKTQAMKDSTAYLITNVLEYAAKYGFHGGTKGYGGTVAAKTGTSNFDDATLKATGIPAGSPKDLWTVAYTPQYSVALWYGYDIPTKDNNNHCGSNDGSAYKEPLMKAIMKYVPATKDGFKKPDSVVTAKVEYGSWPAMKPSKYTPSNLIKTEYFISGTEPTDESNRFAKLNDVTNLRASESNGSVKLTWDYEVPEVLNNDYLTKYFKQSVFGNSSTRLLNERLDYNKNTLGELGYHIYIKDSNGTMDSVAFTTDKSYTYNGSASGNVTFVVKTEHMKVKNNASDGASVSATINKRPIIDIGGGDNDDEDDNVDSSKLKVSLIGGSSIDVTIGAYSDPGIIVIYNGMNKADDAKITYEVNNVQYNNKTDFNNAVNAIKDEKRITIKYIVEYKNEKSSITRSLNLKR